MIIFIHNCAEFLQRRSTKISEKYRNTTLCTDIFVFDSNLQQLIFKKDTRWRSTEIGKRLSHSGDNLFWNTYNMSVITTLRSSTICFSMIIDSIVHLFLQPLLLSCHCCLFCSKSCSSTLSLSLPLGSTRPGSLHHCCTIIALFLSKTLFQSTLSTILKWRHFSEQIFNSFWTEGFSHRCILSCTLLNFNINTISRSCKYRGN
mmetsp:Transcript_4681/g.6649  ORF Transcript_4681/g.6649 Transcript_4681/m.6649 type:complete len:203 (-) Transcript_4681:1908-2516(-)